MPHQCLQCGHAFEEGSAAILQGCPQCKGTRFFYTASPVDAGERKVIADKAQKDLSSVVADVLQHAAPDVADDLRARADENGWADLKPKDLRKLVQQVKARQDAADAPEVAPEALAAARARLDEVQQGLAEGEVRPDTVRIDEPGAYQIDVKGLMEREPLVVHRDGAYAIHLPSLFGKKD